jgi:phosphoenolpyruvate carboxylase
VTNRKIDLSATIHLLGDVLGEVISELESPALFETEERIRKRATERRGGPGSAAARMGSEVTALGPGDAWAVAMAFTVYFDLVNLAEEAYRVSTLRQRAAERHPEPIDESIGQAIARLREAGVTPEQMAALLSELHVEPVLTAHPTEAKRRSLLSKVGRISELIWSLNSPATLPRELAKARAALRTEIATIWLTDRQRTVRPSVTDEVRTGLFFVEEVLWDVLPRIYAELEAALEQHYPGLAVRHAWLRLGLWIGGDRDGNPNVTTEVTAETLRLHRGLAIERHRHILQVLSRRLSLSGHRVPPAPELAAWLEGRRAQSSHIAYLASRYCDEPYRLILAQLGRRPGRSLPGRHDGTLTGQRALHGSSQARRFYHASGDGGRLRPPTGRRGPLKHAAPPV